MSFSVAEGEIFGILGPNGAGKTTTIECASGAAVAGFGVSARAGPGPGRRLTKAAPDRRGAASGERAAALAQGRRDLGLYRSFYRQPADVAELVRVLGLAGKLKDYYMSCQAGRSSGSRSPWPSSAQPKIAMLDEMTTGLDPQARRDTWDLIKGVRDRGATIVLVTHYMEEAERLCDRVALIDRGQVVAIDSPAGLAGGRAAASGCGSFRRGRSMTRC